MEKYFYDVYLRFFNNVDAETLMFFTLQGSKNIAVEKLHIMLQFQN